jgi:lipopolysaccharide transport system permease protein
MSKIKVLKVTKNSIRSESIFLELFKNLDLIFIIFKRDFISNYKQTLLGPLWIVLNPLITSFVFTIIFSKVANISTDKLPPFIFYFSALTIWNFFQSNITQISVFYIYSSNYFRKLYFPRLIIPISYILNNSVRFLIQFFILLLFCFFIYDLRLSFNFLSFFIFFFLYLYCMFFCLGIGLILNSFTFIYRDLSYIISFALTIWMYLSPVVYPISQAPPKLKLLLSLNPVTMIIELFRYSLFRIGTFNLKLIILNVILLIIIFIIGILMLIRTEKNFIDTV